MNEVQWVNPLPKATNSSGSKFSKVVVKGFRSISISVFHYPSSLHLYEFKSCLYTVIIFSFFFLVALLAEEFSVSQLGLACAIKVISRFYYSLSIQYFFSVTLDVLVTCLPDFPRIFVAI